MAETLTAVERGRLRREAQKKYDKAVASGNLSGKEIESNDLGAWVKKNDSSLYDKAFKPYYRVDASKWEKPSSTVSTPRKGSVSLPGNNSRSAKKTTPSIVQDKPLTAKERIKMQRDFLGDYDKALAAGTVPYATNKAGKETSEPISIDAWVKKVNPEAYSLAFTKAPELPKMSIGEDIGRSLAANAAPKGGLVFQTQGYDGKDGWVDPVRRAVAPTGENLAVNMKSGKISSSNVKNFMVGQQFDPMRNFIDSPAPAAPVQATPADPAVPGPVMNNRNIPVPPVVKPKPAKGRNLYDPMLNSFGNKNMAAVQGPNQAFARSAIAPINNYVNSRVSQVAQAPTTAGILPSVKPVTKKKTRTLQPPKLALYQ